MSVKSIKVVPLTSDNFAPYGKLIKKPERNPDATESAHNWWGNVASLPAAGAINTGILQVKNRDFIVSKFEMHNRTAEMLIPLEGESILVVAKCLSDSKEIEKVNAFYLDKSQTIIMDKGTLHWVPFPLQERAEYAVVFRADTPEDDLEFIDIENELQIKL